MELIMMMRAACTLKAGGHDDIYICIENNPATQICKVVQAIP
jgi:hypothetical protein